MKVVVACLGMALALIALTGTTVAQGETPNVAAIDAQLALLRSDLRAQKKNLIALNVPLTADEAAKFWPVYDKYVAEMAKHNDDFYAVIKDYAANEGTMTDSQASRMIRRWADIQVQQAQTRQKYIPLIEKTIPGKKAALFFQIDRRVYALMDMQVAGQIPLVVQ
jgi:hypothetical protein